MGDGKRKVAKKWKKYVPMKMWSHCYFIIPVEKNLEQKEMMTEDNQQEQRWQQESGDKDRDMRYWHDNQRMN